MLTMFARRRQVQPDVIRSVEGAPHRRNDRESNGLRTAQRRARRATPRPRWNPRPAHCQVRRRNRAPPPEGPLFDEADRNVLQTSRMFEGDRSVPTETANAPRRVLKPQRAQQSPERKVILSCPYNAPGSPAAPRVRSARRERRRATRECGRCTAARMTLTLHPFTTGCM
jgi:hypothetical protein